MTVETHPCGSWFVVWRHPELGMVELGGPFNDRAKAERLLLRYVSRGVDVTVAQIVPVPTTKSVQT